MVATVLFTSVEGGRHGSMGGWRRRLQETDYTDFCANFPNWGTFFNQAEKTVMYVPEEESSLYYIGSCTVATCGSFEDDECENQDDCEAASGIWTPWTDVEGNSAANATPSQCDILRTWGDERKDFIQDPNNQGSADYDTALHTYILLENHYACCTIRSGTALQIMDLLSRINLLCSSYDSTVCDAARTPEGERDCHNVFEVCPAVTAPNGQGLDLDAIGNYGAVVIDVNQNFQDSTEERRRLTDANCKQINAANAESAGTPNGRASLLLSWGTEYYGQQLGHVALIVGDLDHTTDSIPDENWVSFAPASNSADYQAPITLGDTYNLLQGMKARISSFTNEYGLFDDYITIENVDEQAMLDAWAAIRERPGRYSLIDRNCMTVVSEILNAGMAPECRVNTRNLITPAAYFAAMQTELSEQIVTHNPEKAEALSGAYTQEKEEVPECQCDLAETHAFHCQRTSFSEQPVAESFNRSNGRNISFSKHHKIGSECMHLAKDMKCSYGTLCRNPNYKAPTDDCSIFTKRTDCVRIPDKIGALRVNVSFERDYECIWNDDQDSCSNYVPGDCGTPEMATLDNCSDNKHVCELTFYNRRTGEVGCEDSRQPSCPSLGGVWSTVNAGEIATAPICGKGLVGTASRKCEAHDTWGEIDYSQCAKATPSPTLPPTPLPTETPVVAPVNLSLNQQWHSGFGRGGRRLSAGNQDGRELDELDEQAN